jgi:hypothetical protein
MIPREWGLFVVVKIMTEADESELIPTQFVEAAGSSEIHALFLVELGEAGFDVAEKGRIDPLPNQAHSA